MNIKIRKVRESAQLPKHVGGNKRSCWMDLYVSRIEVQPEYGRPNILDVDLRFRGEKTAINYHAGDIVELGFGVAMELPEGYEAWLVPRSSTETNFGLVLTNSHGVIDEAYAGDTDEWKGRFLAVRDGSISIGDRPVQFRIHEKMPEIKFLEVDKLENQARGGYGTSGK